jgi:hypothetical protein
MPERFPSIFLVAGAALIFLLLWVASIVVVYIHSRQRGLDDQARMTWVTLTTLLPVIGFAAYLVLGGLFGKSQNRPPAQPYRQPGGRATLYQAQGPLSNQEQGHMDTIAGIELLKSTKPGSPPPPFKSPFHHSRPFRASAQSSSIPATSATPPTAQPVVLQLTAVSGPYRGQNFLLEELPARLGRGSWATIHLDQDLSISRQHAEIVRQDGGYRLRDLNSAHGTRLNGQPVKDSPIAPGDRIELGSSEFQVQTVDRRTG